MVPEELKQLNTQAVCYSIQPVKVRALGQKQLRVGILIFLYLVKKEKGLVPKIFALLPANLVVYARGSFSSFYDRTH